MAAQQSRLHKQLLLIAVKPGFAQALSSQTDNMMTFNRLLVLFLLMHTLDALEWQTQTPAAITTPQIPFASERPAVPLFSMQEHEHPATVYAWTSLAGLHLEVSVTDPAFTPSDNLKQLWRNDCLYIEIDGHGDNSTSYGMHADDVKVFCALSATGPVVRIMDHGLHYLKGDITEHNWQMRHNKNIFTYRGVIPWKYLHSAPGLHTHLGIAVNVAHKGSKQTDNVYGHMSHKRKGTRSLELFSLGRPTANFFFIGGFDGQLLLSAREQLSIPFSAQGMETAIAVRLGKETLEFEASTFTSGFVHINADDLRTSLELSVQTPTQKITRHFESLAHQYTEIMRRLEASNTENAIAAIHVNSLKALCTDYMNRANIMHHNNATDSQTVWYSKLYNWQRLLLSSLPKTGFDLHAHLQLGKPLALAFVSEGDGSLQFASLQVPVAYNPQQRYPLVCYLHGAGPRFPVDYLNSLENNSGQDTLWLSGADEKIKNSAQRQCILVSPFGRGTRNYQGLAEDDVWQALAVTEQLFSIDADRRYISGFSMGCAGSFALAARRPDYWAAVNLSAGFHRWGDCWNEKLYENVSGLPLVIWCGTGDKRMHDGLQALLPTWKKRGFNIDSVTTPTDVVHTYPYFAYSDMLLRCFKHRRGNVEAFNCRPRAYDGSSYRIQGRYGFTPVTSGLAWDTVSFSVQHKDNTFNITSDGDIRAFHIDPHAFGHFANSRRSDSHVIIQWNDKAVYSGPLEQPIRIQPSTD